MRKIENFMQQSMERYTQVERNLVNRSSILDGLGNRHFVTRDKGQKGLLSNAQRAWDSSTDNVAPWLQTTYKPYLGFLYPIGSAISFNKWVNPNCPRPPSPPFYKKMGEANGDFFARVGNGLSDIGKDTPKGIEEKEKQAIADYLKALEKGEVLSNIDQYVGMDNNVSEGYVGEHNIY